MSVTISEMTTEAFEDLLKKFLLRVTFLEVATIPLSISLEIDIQPNSLSFSGEYNMEAKEACPLDIKKVNKSENRMLGDAIISFHRKHTDEGRNRWNKAIFQLVDGVSMKSEFIWDEEREELKKKERQKMESPSNWYWDEK